MPTENKPLLPLLLPWCDTEHRPLRPTMLIRSRTFCIIFLSGILVIWFFVSPGVWAGGGALSESIRTYGVVRPVRMFSNPFEYLLSFFSAPWLHNGWDHIFFNALGYTVLAQSFEARNSFKETLALFYGSIFFAGILASLSMHMGHWVWPENEFFIGSMKRTWMGGSAGLMGLTGALSLYSRHPLLIPLAFVGFEFWNINFNGIHPYVSIIHLSCVLFGFAVWRRWIRHRKGGGTNHSTTNI